MQFRNLVVLAATALLGTGSAATLDRRLPRYAGFSFYEHDGCPNTGMIFNQELSYGNQCGRCNPVNAPAPVTMKSVRVHYITAGCDITVHNTADCSDLGIISGPNCWSPPGGVLAWKFTCPGVDPNWTYQPPCAPPTA